MEEEGFHLPSEEAEAALNSAKSLSKWFEGRKAVEEFNNKLDISEGMYSECGAARQQCRCSVFVVVIPETYCFTSLQSELGGFFQDGECASKCTGVSVCYAKTDGLFSEETASYSRSQHKFTSSRAHLH